jgi:probable HAF family extracellular repeat protein
VLPLLAAGILVPVTAASAASGPVDLGTLVGPSGSSAAFGINDAGLIVGNSSVTGGVRAVVWQNGAIRALPVPTGTTVSNALRVNNRGTAIGWAEDAAGNVQYLVWSGVSGTTPSMTVILPGFAGKVTASGINDNGDVVGSVAPTGQSGRAVRFVNNYTATVDVLPFTSTLRSFATDITNLATGTNLVFGRFSANQPFEQGNAPGTTGYMFLPEPTGTSYSSVVKASTDGSTAVGSFRISTGPNHAQVWTAIRSGTAITGWTFRDLGTLGGTTSVGNGVDPAGTTVVGASTLSGGTQHAFSWQSGTGMRDLQSLLGTSTSCYSNAHAIGATGRIVGESCTSGGSTHAVYWN